jgi:two-component system, cell cycle sensor histidine kinase PleC
LQPFRQVDSSLARRYEGTGLGLPLTRAFVEAHAGRLVIDSVPGGGTTARVVLPAARVRPALPGNAPCDVTAVCTAKD